MERGVRRGPVGTTWSLGKEHLMLKLKCDRHRVSFSEHLFASLPLQHERLFVVNYFLERLFAVHSDHPTEGV